MIPAAARKAATALAILFAVAVPLSISGTEIALGGLVVLWGTGLAKRWWGVPRGRVMLLLALLAAWRLVAVVFSVDPLESLKEYRSTWSFLAVPVLATFAADPGRRKAVLRAMTVTMSLLFLYAGVQFFTGIDIVRRGADKVVGIYPYGKDLYIAHGTFSHHLTFANTAMMGVLLMAGLASGLRGGALAARLAVLVAGGFALMASASRGPWMGLAAGLLLLGVLLGARAMAVVGATALALAAAILLLFPPVGKRVLSVGDRSVNQERIYLWESGLAMVRDNPVTGIGPGTYAQCTAPYRAKYRFRFQTNCHAHNTFLQIAIETGIPGLLLFLVLVASWFREAWSVRRRDGRSGDGPLALGAVLAVAGFLVAGLTQHNFGDMENVYMLWFVIGIVLAARATPPEVHGEAPAA